MKYKYSYKLFLLLTVLLTFCSKSEEIVFNSTVLNGVSVSTWMYQIQGLEKRESVDKLFNTKYDMFVVEPGSNFKDEPYDTAYIVSKLKKKPDGERRILLAYIDIGEAEDYRLYWQNDWVAPDKTHPGTPDFLITEDPDGWSGNYPVAYWDKRWQNIWLGKNGIIEQIANYGFDGVYLDWVEAYDDDSVREFGEKQGVNTEKEMMKFIENIRAKGRTISPDFLIISQNAPYLLDTSPDYYASLIDGFAAEDTWFYGDGDAEWDSSDAGDLTGGDRQSDDYSTKSRIIQYKKYLKLGVPVFTVDYCISKKNADSVYDNSRGNGFIPLVTRVSLSRITETPPF